ncbi:SDR family NAD(P)-dependent oxidoreductase [Nocardioides sp. zg-536]|uniref:SDR family NAD(P)-dependent oxidoreductase n=1 Tax=Nocardioides faecalis TaxID=2803858 RepID=A0A939BWZ6_9ACTN|nr:SDR family NAD(P)-dependent oxidoreductase [Nocardioides faecalis]MBM9461591.1 SDR family NAD(P)-dependent oxidoreductase [Nocardioides faecalis]QVI57776.1 SDR family NAD(P)-dependent oxidoreductase [Nocardioides faecalis]
MRVLVTGGASGLGAAMVARFAARGDDVVVADLPHALAALEGQGDPSGEAPGRLHPLPLDVTSDADWAAARAWVHERWGGLDVLVNNAGVATGGRIDVVGLEEWQRVIDVNLLGVVRGCRTFAGDLKAQGSGHIVNTASLAGLVHPPGMASYTAVKAGVVALSESLAYELHPFGVQVTALCPGFIRTPLSGSLTGSDTAMDAVAARLIDSSPYTADQVADALLAGMAAGDLVVLPDPAAEAAVRSKHEDRAAYDAEQRRFAARIAQLEVGQDASGKDEG